MAWRFETLGNAIVQFFQNDEPILVTDPWLIGTAYFGSWGIERPLDFRQIENAKRSQYVWISHGHPDHLHPESLGLLDKNACEILLPDHYSPEIHNFMVGEGFKVRILRFKEWVPLHAGLRVMCLQNENMDAILAVEAGDTLVLNKNDSPFCGEERFFRKLVRKYKSSYLLALCAVDADMLNIYDADMRPAMGLPEDRKPGAIWAMSRLCDDLGVKAFCCSSSQHIYLRADSIWANPFRIDWGDMERHWCARTTKLIPPYVTVDLANDEVVVNARTSEAGTSGSLPPTTANDDWNQRLSDEDWFKVEAFIAQFQVLGRYLDFISFVVGGETRRFFLTARASAKPVAKHRGLSFHLPRGSLMETVAYGYFDDLLIGNFMKTQLHNTALYPHFSPVIAKLGGNAKVFTPADLRRFRWYFFKLSPVGFLMARWQQFVAFRLFPFARHAAKRLGLFSQAKMLYRWVAGGPSQLKGR
jgi:hypothetical protein